MLLIAAAAIAAMPPALASSPALPTESYDARAVQGVIDLSRRPADHFGSAALDGEWELVWNALLEPKDFARNPDAYTPQYVQVPDNWANYKIGDLPVPNHGFGTYRLRIKLSRNEVDRPMAIYVPSVATSYKLWLDGRLAGENGKVGTSKEAMVPKNVPTVYYFRPATQTVEVVIQVSNFVQRKGGLWQPILFGDSSTLTRLRISRLAADAAVIGCILLMGLYHFGLFAVRRKAVSALYFGGVCLAFGFRTSMLGETLAVYIIPSIPWEAAVKTEYIGGIAGIGLLLLFALSQYPQEAGSRTARTILLSLHGISALIVLVFPASVYTNWMMVYIMFAALPTALYIFYVYLLAAIRRRDGSLLNGIGFIVFILTFLNDVLFYTQFVQVGNFTPFGLLAFLFAQSLNLAGSISTAFKRSEQLSEQLAQTNELLEVKVNERTAELRDANDRLKQRNEELSNMEQSRRQLLSAISHELGTPLTSIQGYLKLMVDGIVRERDEQTLRLVYDKTLYLDRIIQDLFELSKLEAKQIKFYYQKVSAKPFLQQLVKGYAWDEQETKVKLEIGEWESGAADDRLELYIDPIRIEQVFANLVVNAKKFTLAGGTVRVEFETAAMPDSGNPAVVVKVTDNGVGISKEELPLVFERYYRGAASMNARIGGAGLGLAISKRIIEQHDGYIGAVSAPEHGSTFYFMLPLYAKGIETNDDNQG